MKNLIYLLFILTTITTYSQSSKMKQRTNIGPISNKKEPINNEIILLSDANIAPVFSGCEKLESNLEKTNCLITNLNIFTTDKINKSAIFKNSTLKKKIYNVRVLFIIDQNGFIKVKNVLGEWPKDISKELINIIESAPKLTPARNNNKNVSVKFSIKIPFNLK